MVHCVCFSFLLLEAFTLCMFVKFVLTATCTICELNLGFQYDVVCVWFVMLVCCSLCVQLVLLASNVGRVSGFLS